MSSAQSYSTNWASPGLRYCALAGGGVVLSVVAWCLLATHSRLGNLLTLLAGGFLGVLSLCAAAVAALFYISEPAASLPNTSTSLPGGTEPGVKIASASFGAEPDSVKEAFMDEARKKELRGLVIQKLLQTSKRKGPPHQLSQHGEYSGWVWTMPETRYDRTEALLNWPPATEGPKAAAIKWFGGLKAGRIFLARQTTLEDSDVVPVVEIPLAGCSVRLVTEGLRGKTRWWRKTPLEISHPTRALLARQRTFFLFCDGSAAKEQWLTAVSWACSGGGAPQAVQDLYATFCSALRDNGRLSFPQAHSQADHPADSDTAKEGLQGAEGAPPTKKKGLFKRGWGSGRKGHTEKQVKASKSKLGEGTAALAQKSAAFLNPEDLDKRWMEAPKSKPAKQQQQQQGPLSKQDSLEKGNSSHEGFVDHAGDSIDDAAAAGAGAKTGMIRSKSGASISGLPSSPLHTSQSHDAAGGMEADDLAHHHSGDSDASLGSPMSQHGTPRHPPDTWHSESSGQPVTIAIEHAINMLLARVAFDLLRSPKFKQQVVAHIQKKLDELKVPDYINALQVVDVDLGSGVPHIRNLQALASPTATIWPQALFDLEFTGDIKLVLAAKVDVRDGVAWSSLDKYIKNIEGVTPNASSSLPPHSSDPEAAAAITAAGMADTEEDVGAAPGSEDVGSSAAPSSGPASDPSKKLGRVSQFLGKLQLRRRVAGGIRQLAEQTAQSISKMELKLSMDIKALRGPLCVWLPPPPGDRMWFSFLEPPQLQVTASPLVAGRMVKYSYYIARISSFIASKMQSSVTKNLVFPSCGDIRILQLMSLEHEDVTSPIPTLVVGTSAAPAGKESVKQTPEAPVMDKEIRRYGRTTSASGTTTVATPAPHSAATALAGAAASKGPAPTAPVQASALSASLADTTLPPPSSHEDISHSGSAEQQPQPQPHQAAKADAATGKHQGTVTTAGADPNDPALHGLSEAPSGHSLAGTRPFSPPGPPSFTRAPSFSSTHGSPASKSALEQRDAFSRHVGSGKAEPEHEGVELGMMSGGSQGLAEELLAEQLHTFAPSATTSQAEPFVQAAPHTDAATGPAPSDNSHVQQQPAAAQQASKEEAAGADDAVGGSMQAQQAVSFQSLAALASSHAARAKEASAPSGAADSVGDTARQGPPHTAWPAEADSATPHKGGQSKLAVAPQQSGAVPSKPTVLGRAPSEKNWAYPMPTGSPMFERVRSQNHDQGEDQANAAASSADPVQPMLPPVQAEAAGARGQEQQTGSVERSAEFAQQAASPSAAAPAEAIVYEAPPTGPPQHPGGSMEGASHDMMMAHYQSLTGMAAVKPAPGLAEAEVGPVGSSAQPGHSSPAVQQATLPDEAVAQKGWFGQQLKGNSGLASKVWDSKRDDIQQKGRKLASNVMGSFTRAEEKWRQSKEPKK